MVVYQMGKLRCRRLGWKRGRAGGECTSLPPSFFRVSIPSGKPWLRDVEGPPHIVRAGARTRRGWGVVTAGGEGSALIKPMAPSQKEGEKRPAGMDILARGEQLGRGEARKFGCQEIWNLCAWPGVGPCLFPGLSFPFCTLVG